MAPQISNGVLGGGLGYLAQSLSTSGQIAQMVAGYERRKQEWEFQKTLAEHSIRIGDQQIKIANDGVNIVNQERTIAQMQVDHAEDILQFLTEKDTNYELYDWMSGILESIYSYFLQQATSQWPSSPKPNSPSNARNHPPPSSKLTTGKSSL